MAQTEGQEAPKSTGKVPSDFGQQWSPAVITCSHTQTHKHSEASEHG